MSLPDLHEPTIVVPVEFDDPSRRAVELAVSYARGLGGRVVLVHVVPPTNLPEGTKLMPPAKGDPADLAAHVPERTRRMLDEHIMALLVSGVAVRYEVRTGRVIETVLRVVDECNATLLCVGTHGRTGAARMMLGSVAEGLVRRSHVPVMVARQPDGEAARHEPSYAGAALASGVVAGAATGALGGPVGAVVGGAIGAVVGGLAGTLVEREEARASGR